MPVFRRSVATAAPDTGVLLSATRRDRSILPPSRAYRAATPWLSHGPWLARTQRELGANWREATRNCDRPGTAPIVGTTRLCSYTVSHCASPSPLPADAGSD